ncbi:hypothetical protein MHYP_G00164660 [Metynnis hypsauchen]
MEAREKIAMATVPCLLICNPPKRRRGRRRASIGSPWTGLGSVRFKYDSNHRALPAQYFCEETATVLKVT